MLSSQHNFLIRSQLRVGLNADVGDSPTEVDILNWFGRTALELIGQGGLGYSLDPLDRPGRTEYGDVMKQFLYAPSFTLVHFSTAHYRSQ